METRREYQNQGITILADNHSEIGEKGLNLSGGQKARGKSISCCQN